MTYFDLRLHRNIEFHYRFSPGEIDKTRNDKTDWNASRGIAEEEISEINLN